MQGKVKRFPFCFRKEVLIMNLYNMGQVCREHRKILGLSQDVVANETGYTRQNISKFENGNNINVIILAWYFNNGLTIEDLKKGGAL